MAVKGIQQNVLPLNVLVKFHGRLTQGKNLSWNYLSKFGPSLTTEKEFQTDSFGLRTSTNNGSETAA